MRFYADQDTLDLSVAPSRARKKYHLADSDLVLESDYSNALQLLLKYPAPEPPHGPHTFVDDALYLKDHYNSPGGSSIIMKYTGKMPDPISEPRPETPESKFPGLSLRSRAQGARSPITSPGRFISQRGGVEALFQGAAKNVIERGEKLGINQAVRDAMGEIRRNMQDLRVSSRGTTPITSRHDIFTNGLLGSSSSPGGRGGDDSQTVAALERRNKQLALLLGEAISGLQMLAGANLEGDPAKNLETVETAAAKAQFVKIYLEDSSLDLNLDLPPPTEPVAPPQVVIDDAIPPALIPPSINEGTSSSLMIAEDEIMTDPEAAGEGVSTPKGQQQQHHHHHHQHTASSTSTSTSTTSPHMEGLLSSSPLSPSSKPPPPDSSLTPHRPTAIPTRSTLAQSSFTRMLDAPDLSPQTSTTSSVPGSATSSTMHQHHRSTKRPSNAFLFGEVVGVDDPGVVASAPGAKPFTSEDIFGLEPLRRPSRVKGKYEDLFGGALGES